jgi:hypothetical protein
MFDDKRRASKPHNNLRHQSIASGSASRSHSKSPDKEGTKSTPRLSARFTTQPSKDGRKPSQRSPFVARNNRTNFLIKDETSSRGHAGSGSSLFPDEPPVLATQISIKKANKNMTRTERNRLELEVAEEEDRKRKQRIDDIASQL